jgi:hypothetical protein
MLYLCIGILFSNACLSRSVIMYIRYTDVTNHRFIAFTADLSESGRKLNPVLMFNRER